MNVDLPKIEKFKKDVLDIRDRYISQMELEAQKLNDHDYCKRIVNHFNSDYMILRAVTAEETMMFNTYVNKVLEQILILFENYYTSSEEHLPSQNYVFKILIQMINDFCILIEKLESEGTQSSYSSLSDSWQERSDSANRFEQEKLIQRIEQFCNQCPYIKTLKIGYDVSGFIEQLGEELILISKEPDMESSCLKIKFWLQDYQEQLNNIAIAKHEIENFRHPISQHFEKLSNRLFFLSQNAGVSAQNIITEINKIYSKLPDQDSEIFRTGTMPVITTEEFKEDIYWIKQFVVGAVDSICTSSQNDMSILIGNLYRAKFSEAKAKMNFLVAYSESEGKVNVNQILRSGNMYYVDLIVSSLEDEWDNIVKLAESGEKFQQDDFEGLGLEIAMHILERYPVLKGLGDLPLVIVKSLKEAKDKLEEESSISMIGVAVKMLNIYRLKKELQGAKMIKLATKDILNNYKQILMTVEKIAFKSK